LSAAEVALLGAQAEVACARVPGCNNRFTLAVADRVGNVLAVYRRGAASRTTLQSGLPVRGGLEGIFNDPALSPAPGAVADQGVPLDLAALAAISKAVTGAYLSSSGNAFSTRTASFIVQNHFIPGVRFTAGGPLFGVQFSQLPCGDLVQTSESRSAGIGPRRSPLGLSADPGGFPLYKNGVVVGGIGVIAGDAATYGLDLNPRRPAADIEERVALGAARGFLAPVDIRANRITAGGITLPYSASDGAVPDTAGAPSSPLAASLLSVPGWFTASAPRDGVAYGQVGSGFIPADVVNAGPALAARRAYILENGAGVNRYPASASPAASLSAEEVAEILQQALGVANQARAQIRKPLNSPAEVTVSVVDVAGNILGMARTPDAPIFGTDVSLQKARTAALFSRVDASELIRANPGDSALNAAFANIPVIPGGSVRMDAAETFFGRDVFSGRAFTDRAIGNLARPNFPDGIDGRGPGPLSNPTATWSPFNVGLQLDLVQFQTLAALVFEAAPALVGNAKPASCVSSATAAAIDAAGGGDGSRLLANGIQIFPGGVPIYDRDGVTLLGAIGVSGDGVDQDDMIASLGLHRAALASRMAVRHATPSLRSDRVGLRYVQCPQTPFISSQVQNACNF
jgi:uncharacterized protein GlcG (DUF336 family)